MYTTAIAEESCLSNLTCVPESQSEGIFRINPDNGQEEYVREQLNNGVIQENIDVHCLAGLLKVLFLQLHDLW